ncbi:FAD-dependent monooxygenase [Mycobacterium palustre]|uniref:FAD-dependent oxidoreductase n=1 Tax=Mycobacterium palustre TaxID=153971 RepID=A0A1X1ZLX6_9MYCO|nr:FAD-dependent monooxygenase [Mycobacterium palustre]ORW24356.1 FAD-dependent oxidoreductase [Mycobacterium palustre]
MTPHAVISGAGIGGPALAHQLATRGWRTTVIERFPERRDEGQNIDVRGAAREVARRMGIEDDLRAAATGEVGMRFINPDGSPAASFPANAGGKIDGPTAELEILRGEMSRILVEHTRDRTDYRFATQISDLIDHGDHVTATLHDGSAIDADVVVIAEGLRSRSRKYVTSVEVHELGVFIAYLTIARQDTDDQWWNWQHAPGSRSVHLRPDNLGTTRAILSFLSDVRGLEDLGRADQISILRRTFADVGGVAPRVLAELDGDAPLYFEAMGHLRAPNWSKGRIALLGDTAFYNADGGGTSLALIEAYVLAGELSRTDDHCAALIRYEQFMRPHVDATRHVSARLLRRISPRTPAGISALHAAARLAASPVGRAAMNLLGKRLVNVAADKIDLPDYPDTECMKRPK